MKEKIKTFFCILFLAIALPYIITMCFTRGAGTGISSDTSGSVYKSREKAGTDDTADSVSGWSSQEIEEYVIGMTAQEMPLHYETEALKAQAVIARTNLLDTLERGEEPPERMGKEELQRLLREENFSVGYERLTEAVEATRGVVMTFQGQYIYAAFHAVSAGRTRSAAEALDSEHMPWLSGKDSFWDIPAEQYLKVVFLKKEEVDVKLRAAFPGAGAESLWDTLETSGRDEAGYVIQMKVGAETVTGEAFRQALSLNSSCFYIKEVEGRIRIMTKGLGHGLGMSQYGANEMAREGTDWQEILGYYFENIEISD